MKMKFTSLLTALLLLSLQIGQAQRYLTEVFTDVSKTTVQYGTNISVITGAPAAENLYVNIYTPDGDTETDRPLVIYAHTGSFLPIMTNGGTTGDTLDYTVTEVCTRLAKMGYVAASFTYRKGWNPLATSVEARRAGLINAAYRGIQDFRTVVRFFRKSVENGNTYGIDPDKIAGWGQGTGGYIVSASACLQLEEIYIDKFKNPATGVSYIDTMLLGNLDGTSAGAINNPNLPGYESGIALSFNAGGALGDSSWLDAGEPPMIAAHLIKDPFAPFGYDFTNNTVNCEGPVIVPTTQEFVVNVAGSKCLIQRANSLGLNFELDNADLDDAINNELAGQWLAEPHLWAIYTANPQAGPWDYWDATYWSQFPHPSCPPNTFPACNFHTISLLSNPDMSLDKANRYIDTLIGFFAPRAHDILNQVTSTKDVLKNAQISIYPNPANDVIWVETKDNELILGVELYDLQGRLVGASQKLNSTTYELHRNGQSNGLYVAKIRLKDGVTARRISFN